MKHQRENEVAAGECSQGWAGTNTENVSDNITGNPGVPRISSDRLFDGNALLHIEHDGETYTLRITCNRKLLLTK